MQSIRVENGLVPITPSTTTFTITTSDGFKTTIVRSQYAITGGYAFTDFKSQGQTINTLLVDIRKPPSGSISPFSVYVALSRSRGRDSIRLLSDFNDKLFKTHPSKDLASEMERLTWLAGKICTEVVNVTIK
jgi:ATP-dependent exoDNAse (exonuclease V) alpha subunit